MLDEKIEKVREEKKEAGSRLVRDFKGPVYIKPPFRGLFIYLDFDI